MLEPGLHIEDRYTVVRPLGQGGMATVYLVRHRQLDTLHALKLLHVNSAGVTQRLLREGRVQGRLDHAHIVGVTDVVTVRGHPGLIMAYVAGPDLADLLRRQRLSLEQVDLLARPILEAVGYAHQMGVVHRDLKPHNVLLKVRGGVVEPLVADFGLVKLVEDDGPSGASQTRSGAMMGTPAYMAPEQARSARDVDHRADIFALGAILFELLAGERAFRGADPLAVMVEASLARRQPLRSLRPDAPEAMVEAIDAALEVEPDARPPTCEALLERWTAGRPRPDARATWSSVLPALEDLESQQPADETLSAEAPGETTYTWRSVAPPSHPPEPEDAPAPPPPPGRRPALAALITLAAALMAGGGWWWSQQPRTATYAHLDLSRGVPLATGEPVGEGAGWVVTTRGGRVVRAEQHDAGGRPVPLTVQRPLGLDLTGERPWDCVACEIGGQEATWVEPPFVAEWTWSWGEPVRVDYWSAGRRQLLATGTYDLSDPTRVVIRYANAEGVAALSPVDGVYGEQVRVGPDDTAERVWLDSEGNVGFVGSAGDYGQRVSHDARGRVVQTVRLDARGEPTLAGGTASIQKLDYADPVHPWRPSRAAFEGPGGVPMAEEFGCPVVSGTWKDGRIASFQCEDATGRPMASLAGCARFEVTWEQTTATRSCLDLEGQPMHDSSGAWAFRLAHGPDRFEMTTLDAEGRPTLGGQGHARTVRTYDAHGAELSETRYDADGKPIVDPQGLSGFRVVRDPRTGAVTRWLLLGANGEPALNSRGFARMDVARDERALPVELTYLDPDGQPALSDGRYHRETYAFDERRLLRRFFFYDEQGRPTVDDSRGIHGGELDYDAHGRCIRWTFLGLEREPVLARGAGHQQEETRDERGNIIRVAHFDLDRRPMVNEEGCHAYKTLYDEADRPTEVGCYDEHGQLSAMANGLALARRTWDGGGHLLTLSFFGAQQQPLVRLCHLQRRDYDALGREVRLTCEDPEGQPMIDPDLGFAVHERQVDIRGFEVEARLFGTRGEPIIGVHGWHRLTRVPDAWGRVAEERYFDTEDDPVTTPLGQLMRIEFDAAGRVLAQSWHLADGQPHALNDGTIRRKVDRDATGNPIRIESTPAEPAPADYVWAEERDYDTHGRMTEVRRLGSDGRLIEGAGTGSLLLAGKWARQAITYTERGYPATVQAFDATNAPLTLASGISAMAITWSPRGKPVSVRYSDASGRPTTLAQVPWADPGAPLVKGTIEVGCAGIDTTYDARGRVTRVVRLGVDGAPLPGPSTREQVWRRDGRLGEVRWLDAEGAPTRGPDGFASLTVDYDHVGRVKGYRAADTTGAPVNVPADFSLPQL